MNSNSPAILFERKFHSRQKIPFLLSFLIIAWSYNFHSCSMARSMHRSIKIRSHAGQDITHLGCEFLNPFSTSLRMCFQLTRDPRHTRTHSCCNSHPTIVWSESLRGIKINRLADFLDLSAFYNRYLSLFSHKSRMKSHRQQKLL